MTAAWILPLVVAAGLPLALAVTRIAQAWAKATAAPSAVAAGDGEPLDSAVPDARA